VRRTNTWEGLTALRDAGLLSAEDSDALGESFTFLRHVESRLRVLHNRSMDEVPDNPAELEKLARHLGFEADAEVSASCRFLHQIEEHTQRTRELFLRLTEREQRA
jgi:glutamate-ammonia-ligase adenylyltransferase